MRKPYVITTSRCPKGFRRKLDQAQSFEQTIGKSVDAIVLDCGDEVVKSRLLARAIELDPLDDNEATIEKRIATFKNDTQLVLGHYEKAGKVVCS